MAGIATDLSGMYIMLVKPPYGVSTRQAYSGIVPAMPERRLEDALSQGIDTWKDSLSNDFEKSVFALYPELAQIKDRMYEAGAAYAAMSGSGSTVFGLFAERPKACFDPKFFSFTARI